MNIITLSNVKNNLFVIIDKEFYQKNESNVIYDKLKKEIVYDKNSKVIIYGKELSIPREQTAYGDEGISYKFSGVTVKAKSWIPILLDIKKDVEYITGMKFNFCLINYYENGQKYIGYHKDDEAELGEKPCIASLSFGETRKFYFKHDNPKIPIVKTSLNNGCLCVMLDPTNKYWKHSVPKEMKIKKDRINLTFRMIKN